METLGEAYPKEQARVREILAHYKAIGPAGAFAAYCIEDLLQKADRVALSGDVVAMIRVYEELKTVKD